MILRILVQFVGAVLFWNRDYEGMSLRPFGADGVVGKWDDYTLKTGDEIEAWVRGLEERNSIENSAGNS